MNKILQGLTVVGITLAFSMGAQAQLHVDDSGDVGIGTLTPAEAVDVVRSAAASRFQLTSFTSTGNEAAQFVQRRAAGTSGSPTAVLSGNNLGLISFRGYTGSVFSGTKAGITVKATEAWSGSANGTRMLFQTTQNGTTGLNTVMEITHDGKVKVNGTTLNVPDYVFEDDYQLMALDDLSAYIRENKHLPGVASADEVNSGGLDLAGAQLSVLEKVEELTLYTLQQQEELKALKAENASLKQRNASLGDRMELMEHQQTEMQVLLVKVLESQGSESVLTSTVMN